MNRVRVGGVVYENGEIVATFVHGAWYRQVRRGTERVELEPVELAAARGFDNMPDALTLKMAGGELAILAEAEAAIGRPAGSVRASKLALDAVKRGVSRGLTKYGPFRPETESRNLEAEVMRCLRNAMVFASMRLCMSGGRRGELSNVIATCAQLWLSLRPEEPQDV